MLTLFIKEGESVHKKYHPFRLKWDILKMSDKLRCLQSHKWSFQVIHKRKEDNSHESFIPVKKEHFNLLIKEGRKVVLTTWYLC